MFLICTSVYTFFVHTSTMERIFLPFYIFIITYPFFSRWRWASTKFLLCCRRSSQFRGFSLISLLCWWFFFFPKGIFIPLLRDERRESVRGNLFVFQMHRTTTITFISFLFRSFSFAMNESQRMMRMAWRLMVLGNDGGFVWSSNPLVVY